MAKNPDMNFKAFLFDLNGTMINDMQYHITAWHRIVNEMGANISLERMKEECYGKNQEVLERIFPGKFPEEERAAIGFNKEKQYQKDFKPHLKLIPGLHEFLKKSHATGIRMGIGSAAIMYNIDFVIDGMDIRQYFGSLISADQVVKSKPDPETFLRCAEELGVMPEDCLVFEDTPKGVECAQNAGMKAIVITTMHKPEEFEAFNNIIDFISDYHHLNLSI